MTPWLDTPAGRYLREWEQAQLDPLVADVFGFHAVQIGLGAIDGLRANRMPHRWRVQDGSAPAGAAVAAPATGDGVDAAEARDARAPGVGAPHAGQ